MDNVLSYVAEFGDERPTMQPGGMLPQAITNLDPSGGTVLSSTRTSEELGIKFRNNLLLASTEQGRCMVETRIKASVIIHSTDSAAIDAFLTNTSLTGDKYESCKGMPMQERSGAIYWFGAALVALSINLLSYVAASLALIGGKLVGVQGIKDRIREEV